MQHVPKKFVALILILQPKGPWPATAYKAAMLQACCQMLREEWEPYPRVSIYSLRILSQEGTWLRAKYHNPALTKDLSLPGNSQHRHVTGQCKLSMCSALYSQLSCIYLVCLPICIALREWTGALPLSQEMAAFLPRERYPFRAPSPCIQVMSTEAASWLQPTEASPADMPMTVPRSPPQRVGQRQKGFWHPMRGCRVGEAKQPGPEKRPGNETPEDAEPPSQTVARRRLTCKQTDELPPVPDLDAEEDQLIEHEPMDIADAVAGAQAAPGPRSLLKMLVPRANGKETLLSAAHIGGRKVWRWQIRAAPALAGTERAHPADSLHAFFNRHQEALAAEAKQLIEARVSQLREHEVAAFTPPQQRNPLRSAEVRRAGDTRAT